MKALKCKPLSQVAKITCLDKCHSSCMYDIEDSWLCQHLYSYTHSVGVKKMISEAEQNEDDLLPCYGSDEMKLIVSTVEHWCEEEVLCCKGIRLGNSFHYIM